MDPGSVGSRRFREHILTRSIMSILKLDGTRDGQSRTSSTGSATSATPIQVTHEPKGPAGEEGRNAITAVHSTESTLVVGDTLVPKDSRADPMAGHIEGGVDYKSMKWWQAGMVMVAETISLGILSLPKTLADIGLIPGLILLVVLGMMASYSGFIIGRYKLLYPHIHSFADAGKVLFGRPGQSIFGVGQLLFYIFIMASHILTFAIMMNVVTDHGTCTTVFMFIGAVISFLCTLPRTCSKLSYLSVASFISIIGAVLITMIGVGIDRPGFHVNPLTHMSEASFQLWPKPNLGFYKGFSSVSNMVFAYAGHVAFFTFISELKEPRDFSKSLAFLQISDISMYIITAVVVYYYAGDGVKSPAIDSASPVVRKVAYGVAVPTIIIAGVVNGHVAVKYVYVWQFRNDQEGTMYQRSFKAIGYWVGYGALLWTVAWVIAETIPVFNELLGITSALFASWFTYGCSGMFWFHMNFRWARRGEVENVHEEKEAGCASDCVCLQPVKKLWLVRPVGAWNWKRTLALLANILNISAGAIICVAGLYSSIMQLTHNEKNTNPFSCAGHDNH